MLWLQRQRVISESLIGRPSSRKNRCCRRTRAFGLEAMLRVCYALRDNLKRVLLRISSPGSKALAKRIMKGSNRRRGTLNVAVELPDSRHSVNLVQVGMPFAVPGDAEYLVLYLMIRVLEIAADRERQRTAPHS